MKLRELLKAATRDQHERLEARLDLLRDDFRLDDLRGLLERLYGYYLPCETRLQGCEPRLQWIFQGRFKTQHLERDLRHFGHTDQSLARLGRCEPVGDDSTPATLGRWYVLEGSTLGGQILADRFEAKFQLTPDAGCSFFRGYGPQTGAMWKAYCATLDEHSAPATDGQVVESAMQTFDALAHWLT